MVKSFNLSFNDVLYDMSYANILLYSSVLPSYSETKEGAGKEEEVIDADDPDNAELIHKIISESQ